MLSFVRFDVTQPANASNQDLVETWIREAEAAGGALDAGAVAHLWKVAEPARRVHGDRPAVGGGSRPRARRAADHPRDGTGHEDRGAADLRLPHVCGGPQRGRTDPEHERAGPSAKDGPTRSVVCSAVAEDLEGAHLAAHARRRRRAPPARAAEPRASRSGDRYRVDGRTPAAAASRACCRPRCSPRA